MIKTVGNIMSLMKFSLQISLKASVKFTIFRFVQNLSVSLLPIVTSFLTSNVVNILGAPEGKFQVLSIILIALAVCTLLTLLMEKLGEYAINIHTNIVNNYLEVSFSEKASSLDLSFFDSLEFYNLLANAKRDAATVTVFIFQTMQIISSMISLVTAFLIMMNFNIWISVITLLAGIPSLVINKKYTRIIFEWDNANIKTLRKRGYYYNLLTTRQFAQDIRFFNLAEPFISNMKNIWDVWFGAKRTIEKKRVYITTLASAVPVVCSSIFVFMLAYSIVNSIRQPGDFIFYSSQLQNLQTSLLIVSSCIVSIYDNKLRMTNMASYFELEPQISYDGKLELKEFTSVEFNNVSFYYPGSKNPAIKELSLLINEKEKIAIVGVNGSGKTTLIKLLLRFYDPTEGTIKVNGIDIRQYTISSLRNVFSVMFQEYNTYAFTIKENIEINDLHKAAHLSIEDAKNIVNESLRLSSVDTFVSELAQGVDTYISREYSDDGIVLSLGTQQKLSLAGMFYRNSQVVLLDEPSASLDPESEYRLFTSIGNLSSDKTLIFISHRLANTHMANRIIVIENGQLIEDGTHEQLMSMQGRYYELYSYQSKKPIIAEVNNGM